MKVCLVNSFYEPDILGGAEVSVKILAENLIKKGIEVFVICSGEEDTEEIINGVKVYRRKINSICTTKSYIQNNEKINKCNKIIYKSIEINNIFNKNKFKYILEKENPDVVHVNNIYGISSSIWSVANLMNIPIVQTLRDYFIMCPKSTLLKSSGNKCTKENIVCKTYRNIYRKLSNNISYVTAPSNHTLNKFIESKYFRNINYKCIYNSIDINIDQVNKIYEEKLKRDCETIRFIYLGALTEHKGIKELIESFKSINMNLELHIAGKGDLENYIKESTFKNKNIIYHGFLSGEELEKLLYKGDILIAPSKWEEPFGRIVLDAYKNAMPVIVSNNGGLKEIVDNKYTGLILSEVNKNEIIKSIEYFANNKANIKSMLYNTKEILYKFTVDNQIDEFIEIYNKVIM